MVTLINRMRNSCLFLSMGVSLLEPAGTSCLEQTQSSSGILSMTPKMLSGGTSLEKIHLIVSYLCG